LQNAIIPSRQVRKAIGFARILRDFFIGIFSAKRGAELCAIFAYNDKEEWGLPECFGISHPNEAQMQSKTQANGVHSRKNR
jgi:hypothetical protein